MKRIKHFFRRHGRVALILYIGWCLLKVVALIYIGNRFQRN